MFNQTANVQIDDNIKTDLILKEGTDIIPKVVTPTIQPIYDVNKRFSNVVRAASASTTAATIFTTPTDRDFFLTGATAGFIKDATCDVGTGSISMNITVAGTAQTFLRLPIITLTAQEANAAISIPFPIKVDRNTTISVSRATSTAGVCIVSGSICGYTNTPSQPELKLT